jgi:16S rRNA G966 N2-methylase RsmD/rubrerythrin
MAEQIKCLGKTFTSENERRDYFRNELRKFLPELKKIDGFPIGEDEDIIALSDPPYFTACPNPWLNDFTSVWEKEKEVLERNKIRKAEFIVTEPYAVDISEGKNNPIYTAHTYHTKVPHPAIMRYILHYTQPGDIILDGFAGSGMTGVASQCVSSPDAEMKYKIEREWKNDFGCLPVWGDRKTILSDLSPIASFIAYNYNYPIDSEEFAKKAKRIIKEVEEDYSWMYETKHTNGQKGKINYTVWSEVFACSQCGGEIIFWDAAVDEKGGVIRDNFSCPHCNSIQNKDSLERYWVSGYDIHLKSNTKQTKHVPVLIHYFIGSKSYLKKPDENDLETLKKVDDFQISTWFPTDKLPEGYNTNQPIKSNGLTHTNFFYTKRNLAVLSYFYSKLDNDNLIWFTSLLTRASRMVKTLLSNYLSQIKGKTIGGWAGTPLNGTLYIPSVSTEVSVIESINSRLSAILKLHNSKIGFSKDNQFVAVSSATNCCLKSESVDYIFTDPPFGANIMYSELNFLWESWLKVKTNNKKEVIENKVQGKSIMDYQNLMTDCFIEYYKILKQGKWMTVEFSNTSAAVWNSIQTAIQKAGFIIANVAALDKQQGSFKAVTTPTAVKQDLIISCYKPSIESMSELKSMSDKGIWEFVSEYLHHLPIHLAKENNTTVVVERSPRILYDRLISYLIIHGLTIPIDAKDFQDGLKKRFFERDGMYFTNDQLTEYDEKKAKAPNVVQVSWQVATEGEGVDWLKRELKEKPLKYQDIQPKWMQAITAIRKGDILPELRDILQQNFIEESGGYWRAPNMNEAKDAEILRNKVLLHEFNGYVEIANNLKAKKMKEVRVEALRAGFKNCWERKDFDTIVKLSEKIPQNLLLEDEQLLMYYDIAKDRV